MTGPLSTTLANGLRVVTVPLPHLHSAEVAVYLKVGGRNDPQGRTGLAHFLEHMLFRGTAEYASSLEIEAAFESLGGVVNAATDADSTCFSAGFIHAMLRRGLRFWPPCCCVQALRGLILNGGSSAKRHCRISVKMGRRSIRMWWWDGCSGRGIPWGVQPWDLWKIWRGSPKKSCANIWIPGIARTTRCWWLPVRLSIRKWLQQPKPVLGDGNLLCCQNSVPSLKSCRPARRWRW